MSRGEARGRFTSFAESPRVVRGVVEIATLLSERDSGGRSEVREIRCAAGGMVESFGDAAAHRYLYVVEGEWEIMLGDDRGACARDTAIVAPRGTACSGTVTGEETGRLLVLTFPDADASFE